MQEEKATVLDYLRRRRADLISTLDGLSEYDVRRPMTPTGTNLLGLVQHVAGVQATYLGSVVDRPADLDLSSSTDQADPDAHLWVREEETRADILALHHASAAHADATVAALELDAVGHVPWWPPQRQRVSLHQVLVHVATETARHGGHADILRELIDDTAGGGPYGSGVTQRTTEQWSRHRARLEHAARRAQDHAGPQPPPD